MGVKGAKVGTKKDSLKVVSIDHFLCSSADVEAGF